MALTLREGVGGGVGNEVGVSGWGVAEGRLIFLVMRGSVSTLFARINVGVNPINSIHTLLEKNYF
jgi:hypothetical protein